MANLSLKLKLQ